MSEDTNKDNVVELSQPETISEAAPSVHKWSHIPISREIIQDSQIPIDARMLLIYLLSFKEGWTFYDYKIREHLGIGFSKLKSLFKELRDRGYVKTVPIIGEHGRMTGSKRMFSSLPEFYKKHRESANSTESMVSRQSEEPTARKSEAKITNSIIKGDLNNNNKKIYKKDFEKEFDEFWEQYPKKVDKHKASMIYEKLLKQEGAGLHEVAMIAICGQVREREIKEGLGIWQADPKGAKAWLNGHCWENEFQTEDAIREEFERSNKRPGKQPSKSEQSFNALQEYERKLQRQAREEWLREHGGEPEDSQDI